MAFKEYFKLYQQILKEAFKKIRKIGFKKFQLIRELLQSLEGTIVFLMLVSLQKQVYGRIEPTNYLMLLLLVLGSRNNRLYPIVIIAIQRMFSNNFINLNEDLSGSFRLVKNQLKELLLLPYDDYYNKSFKDVYIQSLITIGIDKDEELSLSIVKNFSLIWRIGENFLSSNLLSKIMDFIIDAIIMNKSEDNDKILKSAFLEIIRHCFESYRECHDQKYLHDQNDVSIKTICHNYGRILFDQVAIQSHVNQVYTIADYEVIPSNAHTAKLMPIDIPNQNGTPSGKFGWCIICRKTANYYCRANRVPICTYQCKDQYFTQNKLLEKFIDDQHRCSQVYQHHTRILNLLFAKYFNHSDMRKRVCFSQIFVYVSSEVKKLAPYINKSIENELHSVMKYSIMNVQNQTQAFIGSLICCRKMIYLRIFQNQVQIMLKFMTYKLLHFLTSIQIKQEIMKFSLQIINSGLIFDLFIALDCTVKKRDSVLQLIEGISKLYIGVTIPQTINIPHEDHNIRKLAFEIIIALQKKIQNCKKGEYNEEIKTFCNIKDEKNLLKKALMQFNTSQKPIKAIKKLIDEQYLKGNPQYIAQFLHNNLKQLSFVNIGILIGDYDQFAIQIRDCFIQHINFSNLPIDQALRLLLHHMNTPGESQMMQRIIDCFSKVYYNQNKTETVFNHSDSVYSFSYLVMMLQTNLHNPQVIDKMTLQQFSNLSKKMNGPNDSFPDAPKEDYPLEFLEKIYKSIEKKQLGFHQKMKQMQIIVAYNQNIKKAHQIRQKQMQKQFKKQFEDKQFKPYKLLTQYHIYPVSIMIKEFYPCIIDVITLKMSQSEQKEEIIRMLELMNQLMQSGLNQGVEEPIQRAFHNLWQEITKISTIKKYILMEQFLQWVRKYNQYLYEEWRSVIYLLSKFYRNKLIKKDNNTKNTAIVLVKDTCYIVESFVENLFAKSGKYTVQNLKHLIFALIEFNKQQIAEGCQPFCLEKISQVLQLNSIRYSTLFPLLWSELRDYYVELGRNKTQKIALFGIDFLKQIITKFVKRKDLLQSQKQYFKPLEDIFINTKNFSVKEYIIGSLSYFINHHHMNIKGGWKIVLAIVCQALEQQDQDQVVKEKAFGLIKRIYESKFTIINLSNHYGDFVQILGRLAHVKDQKYPKGCLEGVRATINYFHELYEINLGEGVVQTTKLDINFWQTIWLPLISSIYSICGDFRVEVQQSAIKLLFDILMKYGKLFDKQFWTMILQGVLRPTFEEITYTSQSKPLKKNQLQKWLKNSFQQLFKEINELICQYFLSFRSFLSEVFKIHQNCIIYFGNKILIQLSITALGSLMNKVGNSFQQQDWIQFVIFVENVLRKTLPTQINSLQSWRKKQQMMEHSYEGKCIALHLFIVEIQDIYEKNSQKISKNIYQATLIQLKSTASFIYLFNRNITLRQALWKQGYYSEMKSLPGLIIHEHEITKFITDIHFRIMQGNPSLHSAYFQQIFSIMDMFEKSILKMPVKHRTIQIEEQQRHNIMLQILLLDTILPQLNKLGNQFMQKYNYHEQMFQKMLNIHNQKSYCAKCQFCQACEMNRQRQKKLMQAVKKILFDLFKN